MSLKLEEYRDSLALSTQCDQNVRYIGLLFKAIVIKN